MEAKIKKGSEKAPYGVLRRLSELLPGFKTPTFADVKRIENQLQIIGEGLVPMQQANAENRKKHNIPETEIIDHSHPLFRELNEQFIKLQLQPSSVKKEKLSFLTIQEADQAVKGMGLDYNDMKLIEFWLIKDDASTGSA